MKDSAPESHNATAAMENSVDTSASSEEDTEEGDECDPKRLPQRKHSCWLPHYDEYEFIHDNDVTTARDVMARPGWQDEHNDCVRDLRRKPRETDPDCLMKMPNFICCRAKHVIRERGRGGK